jgi:hypothetical protein
LDRPEVYSQEQGRLYDFLWGIKDSMIGLAWLEQDLTGQTTTVVSGMAATATTPISLNVNLAAGRIYELSAADSTAWGGLPSDATLIMQQGNVAAQQLTLSTSGLSAGQSRWALIQATFAQVDNIPSDDPNGGIPYFWNSANPTQPLQGEGGLGQSLPTRRQGVASISINYGSPATTGSEVPPNPSAGNVPLYLIDLTFGQSTIAQNQILTAGPSVGVNVPNNYPYGPFLAGLLNSHHGGTTGQAPKIILTSEVQGVLPAANGGSGNPTVDVTGSATVYGSALVGSLVARGNSGGAMSDTLPGTSPGILPANSIISVFNADQSALLSISAGSGAALRGAPLGYIILGPGQSAGFISDGSEYFIVDAPLRTRLGANTTLYCSTAGADTNTGLTASVPLATLQKAYENLQAYYDLAGQTITIQCANGTYTTGLIATGFLVGQVGYQALQIVGNPASPSSCVVSTVGSSCFQAAIGSGFTINGFELTVSGTEDFCIYCNNLSSLGYENIIFGATGASHVLASGYVALLGNCTINGNAADAHWQLEIGGQLVVVEVATISLIGTPSFGSSFIGAENGAVFTIDAASGPTFSGAATGKRYSAILNAVINTSGGGASFFPGNSGGSTSTGGEYA